MANTIHSTGSFRLSLTVVESRGTEMCHAVEPYVSQLCLQTLPGPFDYTLHIVNHTTRASLPEHTVGKAWVTFSEHEVSVKRKKNAQHMKRFAVFLYLSLWKLHYLALKLRHIDRGQTYCQFNTISRISNKGRGKRTFYVLLAPKLP